MSVEDLPEILAIERRSYATPWTEEHFRHEITENPVAVNRIVREGGILVGYASAYLVAGELQINDIAVAPEARRRGIGGRLLDDLLDLARARGASVATLEVRPSNAPALGLYRNRGFLEVGRRAGYYVESGEDALLMAARLAGREG